MIKRILFITFIAVSGMEKTNSLALLEKKRKKQERITHASIMNWVKIHAPKDVFEERVYFERIEI